MLCRSTPSNNIPRLLTIHRHIIRRHTSTIILLLILFLILLLALNLRLRLRPRREPPPPSIRLDFSHALGVAFNALDRLGDVAVAHPVAAEAELVDGDFVAVDVPDDLALVLSAGGAAADCSDLLAHFVGVGGCWAW